MVRGRIAGKGHTGQPFGPVDQAFRFVAHDVRLANTRDEERHLEQYTRGGDLDHKARFRWIAESAQRYLQRTIKPASAHSCIEIVAGD
jgi:hypothetical protein